VLKLVKKTELFRDTYKEWLINNLNANSKTFIDTMKLMRISGRRQEMLKIYREIRNIPEPTLTEKLMYIPNSKLTIDQRFIKTIIIIIVLIKYHNYRC